MNFLNRISIRQRLILTAILIIVIFGFLTVYSITQARNIVEISKDIYEHPLMVSTEAVELENYITRIDDKLHKIQLHPDSPADILMIENEIAEVIDDSYISINKIKDNIEGEEGIALIRNLEFKFDAWKPIQIEIISSVKSGNIEEAINYCKNNSHAYMDDLRQKAHNIKEYSIKSATDYINKAEVGGRNYINSYTISTILIALLTLIIMLIVSGNMKTSIGRLKDAMIESTSTDNLIISEVIGKDEISEMSQSYNELIKRLRNMFWLKDGQNLLSNKLNEINDMDDIINKGIEILSEYVKAASGAFYVYSDTDETLVLKGTYAYTERHTEKTEFKPGEGLIGQCAQEKKPIFLTNINKTDDRIVSGTLSKEPESIFTMPVIYENQLLGVFEVLSLDEIGDLKQDYLKESADIISINLYNAIQRKQIDKLLEESKEKNEALEEQQQKLQQQSEELQQSNSQMEEQQQKLQQQTEELQQSNAQMEEQQQKLQQQSEELQQSNAQMEEQQQVLRQQKDELDIRAKELEQASSYKSQFLANMSHELRTPLNSIILLSKMLSNNKEENLSEKEVEKASIINSSGNDLLKLINDILDISKIEAGKIELNKTSFYTKDLVDSINQMFIPLAKEKNLDFSIKDKFNNEFYGDKEKLIQILRNFVANSIKFTEKGSIKLRIMREMNNLVFVCRDTGIGISQEKKKMIFDAFNQADNTISSKYGGSGLGLFISSKLAHLMGGDIDMESEPGKGSEFKLMLPLVPGNIKDLETVKKEEEEKKEKKITDDRNNIKESDSVVMIVDDDTVFSNLLRESFGQIGFKTIICHTGEDTLKYLEENKKVDVILLDIGLPDKSGIEILREIRTDKEIQDIPVYIVTGMDEPDDIKENEIMELIKKPITEKNIDRIVSNILAKGTDGDRSVLIVEDDNIHRMAIKELFEEMDIIMQEAVTENEAKKKLKNNKIDIAILDMGLKEGNGMNICKYIKEKKLNTTVIVYTARDLSIEENKEMSRYAQSIILKTVNSFPRLKDEVLQYLGKKHKVVPEKYIKDNTKTKSLKYDTSRLTGKSVMIVDDDPKNIFVMAAVLEEYDLNIIEADNGLEALKKIKREKIDLILMDIMMPEMDGYETIKAIRKDKQNKDIPIIAVTAKALKGDRDKCIQVGANDYISKPVDYDLLISLLKAWLEKSK
jgi:CheY-like chemotaxis protein